MSQLSYWKVLTRRKTLNNGHDHDTKLNRVLTTYDLTALGVGATLGVGVYVLAGHVAKEQAGPSVVISFAIAAMASLLAGICYAEFGARVPKAGSAYIYSYVCIGEFAAFIIGWNLILEYIIGSASVCRGISLYLDALLNDAIKDTFLEIAPIRWGFLATYFDFLAFALAVVFGVFLSFGFQTSTHLNNCCTLINVGVVIFVIIAGSIKADIKNWEINPVDVNITLFKNQPKLGEGGFFPFGFEGTLKGAATCFFGFVGFDCIATTGEEVKEPRQAIPRAILLSLFVIFLSYFGVSTVLTLMWPYYLQDVDAPLPYAFGEIGWPVAKWIVTIGGMLGLIASLFGALFPLPRIIYAMSQDGLLFKFLGEISPRFKAPVIGSVCAAFFTGIISGLFDLKQLVNMMSIGTLLAYTVVAISITILRFMDNTNNSKRKLDATENSKLMKDVEDRKNCSTICIQFFNFKKLKIPNDLSTSVVCVLILTYCLCCLGISLTIMYAPHNLKNAETWVLTLLGILIAISLLIICAISVQPREENNPYFTVPLVPLVPAISIFVNIYLMLQLDIYTWIRFGSWMIIGLFVLIACLCLHGRDYDNRHVEFRSYLRYGGVVYACNDQNKIDKNSHKQTENDMKFAKQYQLESNENSVKSLKSLTQNNSLDEIISASEATETMKEMKLSNGKTCFIENDATDKKESISSEDSAIEDDPKLVLAILDDVLQYADETEVSTSRDYRKVSVDSEMLPSFIEMSTSAMIHSSCVDDCFREEEENSTASSLKSSGETMILVEIDDSQLVDKNDDEKSDNYVENSDVESVAAVNITMAINDIERNIGNEDENIPEEIIQRTLTPLQSTLELAPDKNLESIESIHVEEITNEETNVIPEQFNYDGNEIDENSNPDSFVDKNLTGLSTNLLSVEIKETGSSKTSPQIVPIPPPLPNNQVVFVASNQKENALTKVLLKKSPSPVNRRRSSVTSNSSIEDPNRLQNFKKKLNMLISRPPPLKATKKPEDLSFKQQDMPATAPADAQLSPIKLSKSETDLQKFLLSGATNPLENVNNEESDLYNNSRTSQILKQLEKSADNSHIPIAPKFDEILYKSLGAKTYNQIKERPKLDELVGNNIKLISPQNKNDSSDREQQEPQEQQQQPQKEEIQEPLNFKEQLAAIIKRGPSYRIQKQLLPSDNSPRTSLMNKSNASSSVNHYSDVLRAIKEAKNLIKENNDKDMKRLSATSDSGSAIELSEARKKLRPLAI